MVYMKKDFKKLLPGVKENVLLKEYSTFRIGGKARYFFVATKKEDLIKAVDVAKKFKLPFFLLGNGSNLLISDKGFKGLVIKIQVTGYNLQGNKIYAEAGIPLSRLVSESMNRNLTALEWAAGIPGTLGGAIFGNAGAFGKSIGDSVEEVEAYDLTNKKIKILKNKDCQFRYRESIFKKKKNLIILSTKIRFKKGNEKEIQKKIKGYLKHRSQSQPLNFPSIGSIFKNPKNFSAGRHWRASLSAGYLIEKCGLKGKRIGDVKISEKHANFIINLGKGKAKDVKKLINLIKKRVKEKFGITLKEEIQYLGF
jgi:UDP-N-acetylmuramate dehydrogenase